MGNEYVSDSNATEPTVDTAQKERGYPLIDRYNSDGKYGGKKT